MNASPPPDQNKPAFDPRFPSPEWYDLTINWKARLDREIPVLMDVFGSPAPGGLLDAGCGTGRHALALAMKGYRIVGADLSDEMLSLARAHSMRIQQEAASSGLIPRAFDVRFIESSFADLPSRIGTGFDGVFCLGNALAAAAEPERVRNAIAQFAACLRSGGRLFVQVLNFAPLREQDPCVQGPRVVNVEGQEYVSTKQFNFEGDRVKISRVTLWNDGQWRMAAHGGNLYAIKPQEIETWCQQASLRIDNRWGDYRRTAFDINTSQDFIVTATRS